MLSQLIPIKDQIHIFVFLLKVPLKGFGNSVLMWMLEENQYLSLKNGIRNSKMLMKNLVKTVKEFLVLLNIIYQKINILKILNSILKNKTFNLNNNAL
jgi:hypothetical protein